MSELYKEKLIRFPLRATHLQIMAATGSDGELKAASTPLPASTARRQIHDLTSWGLLQAHPKRYGVHILRNLDFAQAARSALEERPDLTTHLRRASALAVLAALPSPTYRACAAVSGPTWRTTLEGLHRANLVLREQIRGQQVQRLNDDLPALRALIEEYRRLQARWPMQWSNASLSTRDSVFPIHVRGVEAAWRVHTTNAAGAGMVDWSDPFFAAVSPSALVYVWSARHLDTLDHALLLVRSETGLHYNEMLIDPSLVDARLTGLLATGVTLQNLQNRKIEQRFSFYGLGPVHDELLFSLENRTGPVWASRKRLLEAGAHGEGLLS